MDRPIVYSGEVPRSTDFLGLAKDALYGFGYMAAAAIGPNTGVAGLQIAPTGPASLSFTIGTGSIYASETVDATAYGILGTDANTIIKQGILAAPVTLTVTAPSTSGFSQVYIVQVGYSDVDNGAIVPPYFNSANPGVPFNGAGGGGGSQNTIRQGALVVQLKAGTAATTGSQTTPTPDPGFTALWAVTVANGATTVTSSNWKQLSAGGVTYGSPWFPNLESLQSIFLASAPSANWFVDFVNGVDAAGQGQSASLGAFKTIQFAINTISSNYAAPVATLNIANSGSYGGFVINPSFIGSWVIVGNTGSPSSVVVNSAAASVGVQINSSVVSLRGLKFVSSNANVSCNSSTVTIDTCALTAPTGGVDFCIDNGSGKLVFINTSTYSGNAKGILNTQVLAETSLGNGATSGTISVASNPVMSVATVNANDFGLIVIGTGSGITGTVTGTRAASGHLSVIDTSGQGQAACIAGSANGTPSDNSLIA